MKTRIIVTIVYVCIGFLSTVSGLDECCPDQQCCYGGDFASHWKRNTEFSFELDDHNKPKWGIETILPLYQTPYCLRETYFLQGRAIHRGGDDVYNLGLGYRYLSRSQDWLLGVNGFFDSTRKYKHQRLGVGVEALYRQFTLRANYYHPTTGRMTVKKVGAIKTTEEALEGYDAELETPVPYLPWMRLALNSYNWDGDFFSNLHGFKGTLWMNITDNIQIEAGRSIDNKFHNNFIKCIFTLWRPGEIEYTLQRNLCSKKALPCRNLARWTMAKVKRHNDIVIERVTHGVATSGVIIGRGD